MPELMHETPLHALGEASTSSAPDAAVPTERVCSENLTAWNATVVLTNLAAESAPVVLAASFLFACAILAIRVFARRLRAARHLQQASKASTAVPPPLMTKISNQPEPDHPYYDQIDAAKRRFIAEHGGETPVAHEREERLRSRFRSHDPRRWRLSPSRFGTGDGGTFDAPLRDWVSAEQELASLETASSLTIQRPPLAYNDEAARRGAELAGRDWYFSIADFEHALLHGTLEVKPTSRESSASNLKIVLQESASSLGMARERSAESLA